MSEQFEHLKILYSENKEREKKKLEIIQDPIKRPFHILSFKGINIIFFLEKTFVEKDIQVGKGFLYKVAITNSYYYEKLNGEIFNTLDTFIYPLLSDNSNLIRRYLGYKRTEHPDSFSTHFGKAIQSVLENDQHSLQAHIEGLRKWSRKGWAKQYAGIIISFEGFLRNDENIIEKGLLEIVAFHAKQEQPAIVREYINLEATALAKLAWRKGMEVKVESSLIPNELLPVKELPFYEDYDFFNEIQNPL